MYSLKHPFNGFHCFLNRTFFCKNACVSEVEVAFYAFHLTDPLWLLIGECGELTQLVTIMCHHRQSVWTSLGYVQYAF